MKVFCPYCKSETKLVGGKEMYPHRKDLYYKKFYICYPCDAYVGCHGTSNNPLGIPANKHLRSLRSTCHLFFDRKWKSKSMTRTEAYSWMSLNLGLKKDLCHIGMFDETTCNKLLKLLGVK